jgi:type I restriction enzyme S subunit
MELVETRKYKKTELGIIPSDWEVKNLSDNFTLKARIGWQGLTTAEYLKTGDFGLVTGTDFKNGYIDWDNCVYVEKNRFIQDKNIQLKVRDVLVTKDGTIGKVAFVDKLPNPTTLNSGVFVVRPKNENIDNKFFYYLLMSSYFDVFLAKITAGSTITHLYQKDFVTFNFVLPSISEQTLIATALSDADALISNLEQLITKKKLIKQGAMQQLLKPKKGWEVKKLGEVALIVRGASPRPIEDPKWFDKDSTIGWVRISDVTKSNKYLTETVQKLTDEGIRSSRYVANDNLIMSICATVGRPMLTRINVCIHDGFVVFKDLKIQKEYLYYFLTFIEKDWAKQGQTGSQMNLNTSLINNTVIPFPTEISEQTRIATIFSDIDKEITALETKLDKYRKIKQGMMQNLLTGKIRLV